MIDDDLDDSLPNPRVGLQVMKEILPHIKLFVDTVKNGIENPSFDSNARGGAVAQINTTTLRSIAEKMEEFAANLGKVSAFIRVITNRYGPEHLDEQKLQIEKIVADINREKIEEISRYMDRNYVGTLDHERGAVVSGRYVGAIPRIRDALSLLIESLDNAEHVIQDKGNNSPTLAELTYQSEVTQTTTKSNLGQASILSTTSSVSLTNTTPSIASSPANTQVADYAASAKIEEVCWEASESKINSLPVASGVETDVPVTFENLDTSKENVVLTSQRADIKATFQAWVSEDLKATTTSYPENETTISTTIVSDQPRSEAAYTKDVLLAMNQLVKALRVHPRAYEAQAEVVKIITLIKQKLAAIK